MSRAVILQAGDESAINAALGYPSPCYNAATGEIVPGVFTLRHRNAETDSLSRSVLVVDDVEAALPAPIRARVAMVTLARAVVDVAMAEEAVVG